MRKLILMCAAALLSALSVNAQKLTKEQIKVFKTVALSFNNPLAKTLVIRKWTTPIYYKIYGTESPEYDETVKQEAATAFKQIRKLTGLEIHPVTADDSVNFKIVIGRPNKLKSLLSAEVLSYFKDKYGPRIYYLTKEDGLSGVTTVIDPQQYSERPHVCTILQIEIVSGLGLFRKLNDTDKSLFSATPTILPLNFKPADALIIKTLYNKQVLHMMTEKELDEVLKGIE